MDRVHHARQARDIRAPRTPSVTRTAASLKPRRIRPAGNHGPPPRAAQPTRTTHPQPQNPPPTGHRQPSAATGTDPRASSRSHHSTAPVQNGGDARLSPAGRTWRSVIPVRKLSARPSGTWVAVPAPELGLHIKHQLACENRPAICPCRRSSSSATRSSTRREVSARVEASAIARHGVAGRSLSTIGKHRPVWRSRCR
jgi:hypothetical protein